MSLHKNGIPFKLMQQVEAGAEKTVSEWAEEFNVTPQRIRNALTELRKRGNLFYPIGTQTGSIVAQGIITKVVDKEENLLSTMEKQRTNYIDPQLISFARFVEQGLQKHPQLAPVFKTFLKNTLVQVTIAEELLHENPRSLNSKN